MPIATRTLGIVRPASSAPAAVRLCPFDGGELDALGFCATGDGFPWTLKCPWVCSRCRRALSWNGGCDGCKGSATPSDRATWRFEGDYYEPVDTGPQYGHYLRRSRGPAAAPSVDDVAGYIAALRAVVGRIGRPVAPLEEAS
jgi:hypothetical protein